jgi:hypothetical protein
MDENNPQVLNQPSYAPADHSGVPTPATDLPSPITPLADLQQRLAMLTAAGVRQYEDHGLKLSFVPRQAVQGGGQDDVLAQVMKLVEAERAAAGE